MSSFQVALDMRVAPPFGTELNHLRSVKSLGGKGFQRQLSMVAFKNTQLALTYSVIHPFSLLTRKYLLSTHFVPGSFLSIGDGWETG